MPCFLSGKAAWPGSVAASSLQCHLVAQTSQLPLRSAAWLSPVVPSAAGSNPGRRLCGTAAAAVRSRGACASLVWCVCAVAMHGGGSGQLLVASQDGVDGELRVRWPNIKKQMIGKKKRRMGVGVEPCTSYLGQWCIHHSSYKCLLYSKYS
jgi:hypothetical protein